MAYTRRRSDWWLYDSNPDDGLTPADLNHFEDTLADHETRIALAGGGGIDASDVPIADAGNDFTATDVEGALAELQSDHETDAQNLADHIADTTDAHDASAISISDSGSYYTGTTVEAALAEIGAGGGTPSGLAYPWDYLFITDGTTITLYDNAGAVVDTDTDLGALVNAVVDDYVCMYFGTGVFPWTSQIIFEQLIGVSFIGQGGRQNDGEGGGSGGVGGRSPTQFKWTGGAASGNAFSATGCRSLTLRGIGFQWTSAAYTSGDGTEDGISFVNLDGMGHGTPGHPGAQHNLIEDCYFGYVSGAKVNNGGPLLSVNAQVGFVARSCIFTGGLMSVRGHHTNEDDDFANVMEFTSCVFSDWDSANFHSIYSAGHSWAFRTSYWEPGTDGSPKVLKTVVEGFQGITFDDCWVGDAYKVGPAAGTAHIEFQGTALNIRGGRWDLGNGGYSLIKLVGNSSNINIEGVNIVAPDEATSSGVINLNGKTLTGLVATGIIYPTDGGSVPFVNGNMSAPALLTKPPYRGVSTSVTLPQSDHGRLIGVDASGGGRTITLPAVGCVGCTFTIKKIDSSANSVTISPATGTVDGSSSYTLNSQYKFVTLVSNGSNWMITGSN